MFKRRNTKLKALQIDTLIGVGTRILGDIQFKGGLHVDGSIQGNVEAQPGAAATLSISDSGQVEGSVAAPHVVLNGSVLGDIVASERVELGATAKVTGSVYYGLIEMAMGAQINGKLIHYPGQAVAVQNGASVQLDAAAPLSAALCYQANTAHEDLG